MMATETARALRRLALSLSVVATVVLSSLPSVLVSARQATTAAPDVASAGDMIDRIFARREFSPPPALQPQWFDGGASYLRIEPAAGSNQASVTTARRDSAAMSSSARRS
jgi:hypothetical protein